MNETDGIRFLRGQMWHWKDPVYGKKSDGMLVPEKESTIRYSRFVITMEDEGKYPSLLVVPCSSTVFHDDDIRILISKSGSESECFVRVSKIFPADKRSLTEYVCSISPETMSRIREAIINLISPSSSFPITITSINKTKETDSNENTIQETLGRKIEKNLWNDEARSNFLKEYEDNDVEILAKKYNVKVATIRAFYHKFKRYFDDIESNIKEDENFEKNIENKEKNTEELEPQENSDTTPVISSDVVLDSDIYKVATDKVIGGIGKISTLMTETLNNMKIINTAYSHRKNMKVSLYTKTWYESLNKCIFKSFIQFLGINYNRKHGYTIPEIDSTNEHLSTWEFLTRIRDDNKFSDELSGEQLMEVYQYIYGKGNGIDRTWTGYLRNIICDKNLNYASNLNINENGADLICNKLKNIFCVVE